MELVESWATAGGESTTRRTEACTRCCGPTNPTHIGKAMRLAMRSSPHPFFFTRTHRHRRMAAEELAVRRCLFHLLFAVGTRQPPPTSAIPSPTPPLPIRLSLSSCRSTSDLRYLNMEQTLPCHSALLYLIMSGRKQRNCSRAPPPS